MPDLVMHVVTRGMAGRAGITDNIASFDPMADGDGIPLIMGIKS